MKNRFFMILLVILLVTLCACSNTTPAQNETTTPTANYGVEDSIFNDETGGEGSDDKSFSASAPVTQKDPNKDTTPIEDPTETTQDGTTEGKTDVTTGTTTPGATEPDAMTYEAFEALSPAEKRAYQESFSDIEAFFDWYDAAKEAYEKEHPPIEIGGGAVTLPKD